MEGIGNMANSLCRTMLVLAVVTLVSARTYAETFEFLTFAPPRGWTNQVTKDGSVYRRPSGIGLIYFYSSYAATRPPADEFAMMWRTRVETTVPGPAPQPQIQQDGDCTVAVGGKRIDAQGTITTISLVTIVGRGRALGILAITAGDDALREVTAVLDSVNVMPNPPGGATGAVTAGEIDVDFDVPPGYVSRRDGRTVVLTPTTVDEKTPCAYGLSPPRSSSGTLETDARAALLDVLPGWQLKSDNFVAMRGTAGAGWPYFWFRTDVQRLVGGSYEYAAAMTMAFPAGAGRVNIVWGFGNPARCTLDDLAFARLFHSLRPRGWTSDGGRALARDLVGTWRDTQRVGMSQYKFLTGGRYEFGIGTVTRLGLFERTSASVRDGRYELRGADLIVTPDARGRDVSKYRVRIYDEFVLGRWTRAMSLLDENARPVGEVEYMRIAD
jgi:hypothetical protein